MDYVLARVLHVMAVVMWIGGVSMVTTVLLPAVRKLKSPAERVAFFEKLEGRFALQARVTTLVTGITGFYMLWRTNGWWKLLEPGYWWIHAMILVWAVFTLMLFVLEPLFLHRWFLKRGSEAPEETFALIQKLHWFLLGISMLTLFGTVAGAHGWLLFD